MSATHMSHRKKVVTELAIALALLAAALLLARYGRTKFQELVRETLIVKLQTITGGRVELNNFRFDISRLQLEADDLVLHGLEAPGQPPYVHIDRIMIRLKIISLLGGQMGLRDLVADRPIIHISRDGNGITNLPRPVLVQSQASIQNLFEAGVEHVEITRGELFWNDQRIPLDLVADHVTAGLNYLPSSTRYDGSLDIARLETKFGAWQPVASSLHLKFEQERNRANIQSLSWSSQGSELKASGWFENTSRPQLNLAYTLNLDLQRFAQVARTRLVRRGILRLTGSASASLHNIQARGMATLNNAEFTANSLALSNLNARSGFILGNRSLELTQLSGTWARGKFAGAAQIRDWCFDGVCEYLAVADVPSAGKARIQFDNFDVHDVALASGPHSLLATVKPAALASGSGKLEWRGAFRDLETKLRATLQAATAPAPEALPVTGELDGAYDSRHRVLQVDSAHLTTPSSSLNASGELGRPNSKLKVDLQSQNLADFAPTVHELKLAQLPEGPQGAGSFKGTISGTLREPEFIGHITATNLELTVTPVTPTQTKGAPRHLAKAPLPSPPPTHLNLSALAADLDLAAFRLTIEHGEATGGNASIQFSGATNLVNYSIPPNARLLGQVSAAGAPLADVQRLIGTHYPVSGKAAFRSQVSGTLDNPTLSGDFRIVDGSALWLPFKSFAGKLAVANGEISINDGRVLLGNASLTGAGHYNQLTQVFGFEMQGGEFDLGQVAALQRPRFSVEGKANFRAQGSGTVAAPRISAALNLAQLVLNGEPAGDLSLEAITQGPDLKLTAHSSLSSAQIALAGSVLLRGDWPAQLNLNFSSLDIDPLLRAYVQGRVTEHSSVDGHVSLEGPLLRPRGLSMKAEITSATTNIENVKLESQGPIQFSLSKGVLNLDRAHIIGEGTDFSAGGSVTFAETSAMNMRADGRLNLKVLQSFNPDVVSSGITTLSMRAEGSLRHPAVSGRVQIQNAAFTYADLPTGLNDVNGTMVFNENRLQVESLTARAGGGELNLTGFVAYSHGIYFDLFARGNAIRLRYPPGVSAIGDAALRYQGTLKSSLLSGDVTVTKFGINPQFDFALYLARSAQPSPGPKPDSVRNNIRFDVHIVTASELQVETAMARITGDADLRLRGTAARPVVLGRVNIGDGDVVFNSTKYHLDRGDILFTNPVAIQPVLDLEASARVRDVDITLGFHGPSDKMSVTYRSDPPLPSSDIIALLALGRTREDAVLTTRQTQNQTQLGVNSSNVLLGQALNAAMTSRVQRLFGVSRIKIDPEPGGPENNPNARLTVEQQVTNQVTLTYITNLAQSAQQVIQMEVQINRNVSLIAVRDQNGVVGFDLHLRQRKR